jgi:1,4-dihydroxy-6-naphthoate synthase
MGDGYGPCLVARRPLTPAELLRETIAVPGTLTSSFLALEHYLERDFTFRVVPFDRILDEVASGRAEAGLIIHEGQLTDADHGLHLVADLGRWWSDRTEGLPLPLGGNVVRKDLGSQAMACLTEIVRASIDYGLAHRDEALDYALQFGRGLERPLADRFVGMYVNDWTRDYGPRGREAIRRFLAEGAHAGKVPPRVRPEFVS